MSLEQKEKRNPTDFLSADGVYWKNLIGKWVIEGKIRNNAEVADYKDVVLKVHFYSETNTHLGTKKETIYEYVPSGGTHEFKKKYAAYDDVGKIGFEVVDAKPVR